jgi:hypothetical protein
LPFGLNTGSNPEIVGISLPMEELIAVDIRLVQ